MAKRSVSLKITTDDQTTTTCTVGLMKDQQLSFYDDDKTKHKIIIGTNQVIYQKYGEAELDFEFKPTTKTIGSYTYLGNTMKFDIITQKYQVKHDEIDIAYSLYQDEIKQHEAQLYLKYTTMKEGKK